MIRCHLSRFMGEHKMKIMDVARETGLNRNTITLLYKETARRVDLDAVEKLCRLFDCEVGELFERIDEHRR
ncbi:MAG: XRE family transcriptional regulator [Chromatiales bacterium 21-64-14]|nr:MAG: XRE family transcriptional regulator [Chromatiales bacterium 21-64-14]HQU17203.1 helix-turn-helix transcriptional regulator [Gammaproteobacteria bacterium]